MRESIEISTFFVAVKECPDRCVLSPSSVWQTPAPAKFAQSVASFAAAAAIALQSVVVLPAVSWLDMTQRTMWIPASHVDEGAARRAEQRERCPALRAESRRAQ